MAAWIKLHRKMRHSAVMSDDWLCRLWMSCLLKTNWKPGWFRGERVEPGSFAFSYRSWCEELGVSRGKLHRGLQKLERLEQISIKAGHRFSVVSISNWMTYQGGAGEEWDASGTQTERKRNAGGTQTGQIEEYIEVEEHEDDEERFRRRQEFVERWNATSGARETTEWKLRGYLTDLVRRGDSDPFRDPGWLEAYPEALAKFPLRWFRSAVRVDQFIRPGFVTRVLDGGYQDPSSDLPDPEWIATTDVALWQRTPPDKRRGDPAHGETPLIHRSVMRDY